MLQEEHKRIRNEYETKLQELEADRQVGLRSPQPDWTDWTDWLDKGVPQHCSVPVPVMYHDVIVFVVHRRTIHIQLYSVWSNHKSHEPVTEPYLQEAEEGRAQVGRYKVRLCRLTSG